MIPLASGEADLHSIPTSQNVSICLTFLSLQLNAGLVCHDQDFEDSKRNQLRPEISLSSLDI